MISFCCSLNQNEINSWLILLFFYLNRLAFVFPLYKYLTEQMPNKIYFRSFVIWDFGVGVKSSVIDDKTKQVRISSRFVYICIWFVCLFTYSRDSACNIEIPFVIRESLLKEEKKNVYDKYNVWNVFLGRLFCLNSLKSLVLLTKINIPRFQYKVL